jgi:tetratricopeptide (TPR) repeat protein
MAGPKSTQTRFVGDNHIHYTSLCEAPECHFQLGRQHAAAGDNQKAITAYRTSLKGNPYRTVCHISLGFSLLETGQIQDAKECFLKAVDLNPALTEANLGLAIKKEIKCKQKKHSDIWTQSQKSPDEPTYQVSGRSEHSGSVDRASDALDALTDGTLAKHGQSIQFFKPTALIPFVSLLKMTL